MKKYLTNFLENYKKHTNKFILLFLGVIFLIYFILSYFSDGTFGGGDTFHHYKFSRYSLKYPVLLLDLWAKPVFTLLSIPFSQFGYIGTKTGNILFGLLAAYYSFLIADLLKYKNTWFVLFPVIFAPIYIALMFTGMTEVLFSLFLIAGIYYFLKERYLVSVLIISFIPFVRSEGWAVLLLFGVVLLINKKIRLLPLLLSGTLIYSIIGYFVFKDLMWIFHQHPYLAGAKSLYGSGSIFFYTSRIKYTFGIVSTLLICIGLIFYFAKLLKNKNFMDIKYLSEFILIVGSFIGIFFLHSFLWYKGLMSVLADDRFLAGIVPLSGLIALYGINLSTELIKNKFVVITIFVIFCLFLLITPFKIYTFPVKPDAELAVIIESADWLKESEYFQNKIFFYHGAYPMLVDINPYDTTKCQERVFDPEHPEYNIPDNSILVWDAHYSANEGRLPLEKLTDNKYFKMLNVFKPVSQFNTLGDNDYQVIIFQKSSNFTESNLDTFGIKEIDFNKSLEFEYNKDYLTTVADSIFLKINSDNRFSPAITFDCDDSNFKIFDYAISTSIYSENELNNSSIFAVFSVEKNGKIEYYQARKIDKIKKQQITDFEFNIIFKQSDYNGGKINIYIWNDGNDEIYFKKLNVKYNQLNN